jgi:ribosome-binding factor A
VKRTEKHRPERISELIRHAIADAIATELKDPRVGFATVTRVTVSSDVTHANVYVSVLGSEEEKARAMEGLGHANGFLRTYVARHLHIRTAPELHIELDRGLEHAARIDEILDKINETEERSS